MSDTLFDPDPPVCPTCRDDKFVWSDADDRKVRCPTCNPAPSEAERVAGLGHPVARNTDPITSHTAAFDATPNAGTNRALALRVLREHPVFGKTGGLTDYELADLTGLQQNSVGKRRGELRDGGFVRDSGLRRPAPSGSMAIVWEAVPDGTNR